MRSLYFCFVALAMTAPAYTQTTPPAAPSVTAGAEFKGLRFDWESVPGAGWYQFEYRAHQTGPFVQLGTNYSAATTNIRLRLPLHLFDWTYARYRIAACNSAGCTRSNEVSVSDLRRDAVGYFKSPQPEIYDHYGADTDITPDGLNFVVAAPTPFRYDSQGNYLGHDPGIVYVYRRAANGTWTQRAKLTPPPAPNIVGDNAIRVGISADGNTVVMGIPDWHHTTNGLDAKNGEAFVFHFNGTAWTTTRLQSGNRGDFGRWVAINDAGDTIAVPYSEGAARVAIYKLVSGVWQPIRGISNRAGHSEFCGEGVLSSDGAVVGEVCSEQVPGTLRQRTYVRTHRGDNWTAREDIELFLPEDPDESVEYHGLAIDGTGDTIVAQLNEYPSNPSDENLPSEVQVFSRAGGSYAKTATFKPGAWRRSDDRVIFGRDLAISSDGGTIAVGDVLDNGFGTGPRAAPLTPDTRGPGAVYIYRLKSNWVLANMVKPNFRPPNSEYFGRELSLNANGQTLLVGSPQESRSAAGIGGDWTQGQLTESGAVFLY